jgi:hypothetical protein
MTMLVLSILAGCSVRDVRPGANGVHTVSFLIDNKQEAARLGLRQAKRYCKKEKKGFAVLSEKTTYICEMNEEEYIQKKELAEAAQIVGTAGSSSESPLASAIGSMVATGGAIAASTLGDCYEFLLTFECK